MAKRKIKAEEEIKETVDLKKDEKDLDVKEEVTEEAPKADEKAEEATEEKEDLIVLSDGATVEEDVKLTEEEAADLAKITKVDGTEIFVETPEGTDEEKKEVYEAIIEAETPAEEVAEDLVAEEDIPLEEEFVEADSLDELESLEEEPEVVETDDEVELIEEATEEEYEAIVLVPVESNPPAVESTEEEIVEDELIEEETIEPIVAPVVEKSVTVVPEPIILEPSKETETSTSYQKYLVPSLQDLESGKYYIQIASLRDDKNIEEIISKYANNYPITIVPNRAGTVKQVMVGPLSMDEYGVVLQRFKSYGYKDAFLRKIK